MTAKGVFSPGYHCCFSEDDLTGKKSICCIRARDFDDCLKRVRAFSRVDTTLVIGEDLNKNLLERRLCEGERRAVFLYAEEKSGFKRALRDLLGNKSPELEFITKQETEFKAPDDKDSFLHVIGTFISALRKLRVYVSARSMVGYPVVKIAANPPKDVFCTRGFLETELVDFDRDNCHGEDWYVVPYRGMIPVIPYGKLIAVFEPGTILEGASGNVNLLEEAPWDRTQWHNMSSLRSLWFFPVHQVFRRELDTSEKEKDEAKTHVEKS